MPEDEGLGTAQQRVACQGHCQGQQGLGSLDERSADVVRRRYGLVDGRQAKLADIASVWGITAERVRQIERQALAKLRTTTLAA